MNQFCINICDELKLNEAFKLKDENLIIIIIHNIR